ncbi:hypothetical protein [Haladaptatus sp. DFWS20]|uniref:hypothetical protein n=1 Tax=Haladaptatus sp. DFWS20 TaxID=3403467 RepID=UPI003EBE8899
MNNNPFAPMFEMQRHSMKQGQKMVEQSIEIQSEMTDSFVKAVESQKSTQTKGLDAWKSATEASLDAVDEMTPSDSSTVTNMHDAIDDQFDALTHVHDQVWKSIERNVENGIDVSEDVTESYRSFVDESVGMALEANEQFEEQSEAAVDATEFETE